MDDVSHGVYCAEISARADELRAAVRSAEGGPGAVPVAACPGWTLTELARHVGGTHRWAARIVRTRATEPVPHDLVDDVSSPGPESPAALDDWLAVGAAELTGALREAGPDAAVWTVAPGGTARFWARRMTHETTVHAADAAFATGAGPFAVREFAVREELGRDALDEWMGFGALPRVLKAAGPGAAPLTGPGRTLQLHASDTDAEWLVDLTREPVTWSHAHDKAAVTVRAPLTDLVLLLYGRRTPADTSIEVYGDEELLTLWLERSGFWLRK
ncbi:maleylpyruvate isomerase family mycothiol-dependent enzyme [Streptomyces iconiensis]|uniref:Maleylpyruvate isomerase family mycothiol-dependent enzyme n=1 Tax=Streptomyces iconiensis TaxID=1384038 RepID=A0ABT6ZT96_9ACTN|nr:maleylpyruvate isomerase family mycothiol-dependent enzyme [Streptomyces iconiensis]MDJ1132280.1 maleylpyruvate isomerase family mycothiol-dependent enzyme [Streptomyces iconiensis]